MKISEFLMFLKDKKSGDLVSIIEMHTLTNPGRVNITGRYQHGEEEQDPESFKKSDLIFPSGEALPLCWQDSHYRDHELKR